MSLDKQYLYPFEVCVYICILLEFRVPVRSLAINSFEN